MMRLPIEPSHLRQRRACIALLSRALPLASALAGLCAAGCTAPAAAPSGQPDFARMRGARYLLLGEVHDNAEQHRLRAELLARLLAERPPASVAVVFEQMDRGHDAAIDAAGRDADRVADAGQLDRPAWGWPLHRPLIEAALAGGATVRGGDLGSADARAIVRSQGAAAAATLPAGVEPLLAATGWSAADEAQLEQDIDRGHCGALPKTVWPAMALAQRARDATLAEAMLQAGGRHDQVILIAGNGHVRRDVGVPRYLLGGGVPAPSILAVGYLETAAEPGAPYDIVRITPAVAERTDPCLAFRAPPRR